MQPNEDNFRCALKDVGSNLIFTAVTSGSGGKSRNCSNFDAGYSVL